MNVQINIRYSIEEVLRELGQDGFTPARGEIILSTIQDKFFKGGGCEISGTATDGATEGEIAPRNIAVCTYGAG